MIFTDEWKQRFMRLQILVTQRCNAVCLHCDKAVGYAKLDDLDMTEDRMRGFVNLMKKQQIAFVRVSLSGGEPVLNPELPGIIGQANRIPGCRMFRVLTNDMTRTKERRDAIKFPNHRWHWIPAPLDDLSDPLSGKKKTGVRYKDRFHQPFWNSPKDLGLEATFEDCGVRVWCGKGLDACGFSMCGQAPIIGRVLGIDPYPNHIRDSVYDHITKPIPEICEHCMYGCTKADAEATWERIEKGELPDMSETYNKAFPNRIQHKEISLVQIGVG